MSSAIRHYVGTVWRLGLALSIGATAVLAGFGGCATKTTSAPQSSSTSRSTLWDLPKLNSPPAHTWGATTGMVQELFYEGEPLRGEPTQVFAYLARPTPLRAGGHPAMVLVHGGGGTAFREWAEHWARRGYVAIAMDLAGHGPAGRLTQGGPDQSDTTKFRNFSVAETREMWSYHAVAAVIRAHSLLRSLPEVNRERIGITGISWGGYLTCLVAGLDHRFRVAIPVYGCGFLGENSVWKNGSLAQMPPDARARWLELFDPSHYLAAVRCPILFVNGTTDFAYPLDSYQKSYRLVRPRFRHVSVAVNRPHGHIWTFPEVDSFADSVLKGGEPMVRVGAPSVQDNCLSAPLDRSPGEVQVSLCYTTNTGPWQKRVWHRQPAQLEKRTLRGTLPPTRPMVAFLALKDAHGRELSSEHLELP